MQTAFWLNNPSILMQHKQIWPNCEMTLEEKCNAVTRLVLLSTVVIFLFKMSFLVILAGVLTVLAICILYKIQNKRQNTVEGYTGNELYSVLRSNFTEPTSTNPLMNVLLTEINDNPNRKMAAPAFNSIVEKDINTSTKNFVTKNFANDPNVDERLFKDLGDEFLFDRSMRQWYTMPNTRVPEDQKSFAEYCYGDMISCRDITNNETACERNAPPRWTNY
jgi:hypothetical protein